MNLKTEFEKNSDEIMTYIKIRGLMRLDDAQYLLPKVQQCIKILDELDIKDNLDTLLSLELKIKDFIQLLIIS